MSLFKIAVQDTSHYSSFPFTSCFDGLAASDHIFHSYTYFILLISVETGSVYAALLIIRFIKLSLFAPRPRGLTQATISQLSNVYATAQCQKQQPTPRVLSKHSNPNHHNG